MLRPFLRGVPGRGGISLPFQGFHDLPQFGVFRVAVEGRDGVAAVVVGEVRVVVHDEVHGYAKTLLV